MKQIIRKKVLAIAACTAALLGLLWAGLEIRLRMKLDLQTTYIAARDIPPRTEIQGTDLIETRIPNGYLLDNAVNAKEEIIGKYTEIQGMIPAGSVFYRNMLYSRESLPDYPTTQLKEGQAAYTLETDLARLGGEIVPGQRVDIYVSLEQKNGATPVTGCLVSGARVLAVKDHKGMDLTAEGSTGIPFLAILAVEEQDLQLLSVAEEIGSVRLFSSSRSYDVSQEAVLQTDSPVYQELSAPPQLAGAAAAAELPADLALDG